MFRDLTAIMGLGFVSFVMGALIHVKNPDCAIRHMTAATKTGATMHQYRHTPHAVPN